MSYTPDVSMFPYYKKSSCGMHEEIEKLKKQKAHFVRIARDYKAENERLKFEAAGGQTIQDINGKYYQMPTQEQADHYGISIEEMIELMKTTDCDFSN